MGGPGYFYLVAIEFFLAKNTNPLILERFPDFEVVLGTQGRQSIFRFGVSAHCPMKVSVPK
ncbi:MAG: hypothetical protein DME66_05950 [Verrucomicrobia bacterium]|nr:MAG: hypothetical protein DME66_05950 [Verrucomicrobiota bacterium]